MRMRNKGKKCYKCYTHKKAHAWDEKVKFDKQSGLHGRGFQG